MTTNGACARNNPTESNPGAEPATLRPPVASAVQDEEFLNQTSEADACAEPDDATLSIFVELKRRLAGVARLRPQERIAAYRTAIEWYKDSMAALKEQKRVERYAKRELHDKKRRGHKAGLQTLDP